MAYLAILWFLMAISLSLLMGHSRKYPYHTTDGSQMLTPLAFGISKMFNPPCPCDSIINNHPCNFHQDFAFFFVKPLWNYWQSLHIYPIWLVLQNRCVCVCCSCIFSYYYCFKSEFVCVQMRHALPVPVICGLFCIRFVFLLCFLFTKNIKPAQKQFFRQLQINWPMSHQFVTKYEGG